ncbi:MAG TPA: hypothetical protein PKX27_07185 [Bacteroidales bacterium]|jgi:hypothetical protein|nr:hypothetical protein [Bacteroidales bacterium]HOX76082.1 hypothetical protein [Bacteroidales bacterium]HPM87748.1 hypothetical protein [Bacteroidales bacterium]HQM69962.1 hypothetical protein [Bacteroidales bacterium]
MKAKPIIILILTLLIGFVLGMLTSAQLRFNKLKPVRFYFSEERFREGFYRIIQPDEKQKAEIDKILEKHARVNSEMQDSFRKQADSNIKALRKELDAKLTKEQLARVKEMDERREKMIKEARKHRNDSTGRPGMRPGGSYGRPFPEEGHVPDHGEPFDKDKRPGKSDTTMSAGNK